MAGFDARLVEIKYSLGESVMADLWDRGWTKVYVTVPLQPYSDAYLLDIADRMADIVRVLHPIYRAVRLESKT